MVDIKSMSGESSKKDLGTKAPPILKIPTLQFETWGEVSYKQAEDLQLKYAEQIAQGVKEDTVVFCSHPPVVTKGRATKLSDIYQWHGEIHIVSRGGKATYHGPGQLVIYPILNLQKQKWSFKPKDIHAYLRTLEKVLVDTFLRLKLKPVIKNTGIWIQNKKIASIGIAVKKWVSYHGIAINIFKNSQAFQGIKPCGLSSENMGYLEHFLKQDSINFDSNLKSSHLKDYVQKEFQKHFLQNFLGE